MNSNIKLFSFTGAFSLMLLFSFSQAFDLASSIKRGETLYQVNCAACHMAQGEGLQGVFPPLSNSEDLADQTKVIKGIVNGLSGPMEIKGVKYNGTMPAFPFSDQEVADITNYIRNAFGNKYEEAVTPEDVQPALKSK